CPSWTVLLVSVAIRRHPKVGLRPAFFFCRRSVFRHAGSVPGGTAPWHAPCIRLQPDPAATTGPASVGFFVGFSAFGKGDRLWFRNCEITAGPPSRKCGEGGSA